MPQEAQQAQPANGDRIVQIIAQRSAGQIADLITENAMLTEALERTRARVAELEAADSPPSPPSQPTRAGKPTPA